MFLGEFCPPYFLPIFTPDIMKSFNYLYMLRMVFDNKDEILLLRFWCFSTGSEQVKN